MPTKNPKEVFLMLLSDARKTLSGAPNCIARSVNLPRIQMCGKLWRHGHSSQTKTWKR